MFSGGVGGFETSRPSPSQKQFSVERFDSLP